MVNCTGVIDGRAHTTTKRKRRPSSPMSLPQPGDIVVIKGWRKPGIVIRAGPNWRRIPGTVWIGFFGRFHVWDIRELYRAEYRVMRSDKNIARLGWIVSSLRRMALRP